MLRLIVLLLFIANLAFYGWTQGWLDAWLPHGPAHEGPQRQARQVHPERVRVMPLTAAASEPAGAEQASDVAPSPAASPADGASAAAQAASAAASVPVNGTPPGAGASANPAAALPPAAGDTSVAAAGMARVAAGAACLEAGPYNTAERDQVEARLRSALSSTAWTVQTVERPGSWLLYMGPYPDSDLMARKKDELRKLGIAFQDQRSPPTLSPGLGLGRFDDRRAADAALLRLTDRGVRSARVITLRAPQPGYVLRFARADAALRTGLAELGAPAFLGRAPQSCKPAA